ncbi:MAG TPA: phytanoyl-CoA dioxygenase family protein [Bacteroidota bacterium]
MNPDLSKEYPLAPEQAAQYQRDGHILLRGIASPSEIEFARPLITGIVDKVAQENNSQGRISDYSKMFTQVTNVWTMDEGVRSFILAKKFAGIAAALMGVKGVRIYHDQALIKEPGGKPTPWHQDYYYWPLETDHTITMWMALVDIPRTMGSMSFVSGSHVKGTFAELPISDTSQEYFEKAIRDKNMKALSYELRAGDASFHSGRTLHAAHGNQSTNRREVITIIYYADGTRIMKPDNEHREVDMKVFHPGQKPGEPAASSLNPLVYP